MIISVMLPDPIAYALHSICANRLSWPCFFPRHSKRDLAGILARHLSCPRDSKCRCSIPESLLDLPLGAIKRFCEFLLPCHASASSLQCLHSITSDMPLSAS